MGKQVAHTSGAAHPVPLGLLDDRQQPEWVAGVDGVGDRQIGQCMESCAAVGGREAAVHVTTGLLCMARRGERPLLWTIGIERRL